MGAGQEPNSCKKAGKVSIQNSKVVREDIDDISSEGEQFENNPVESSDDEEDGSDPDWVRSSGEEVGPVGVQIVAAVDEVEDEEDDDEDDEAPLSTAPDSLADESTPESALDAAWGEIDDVIAGTEYDLKANVNQGGASKKSTLRSAKSLGKMKALDAEKLTAALKNLKKATYGTVSDIDAEKHRKIDKNKARNQAQVNIAAQYISDQEEFDKNVEDTAQDLKDHSTFFFVHEAKAEARAEILESRKIIKYHLEPESVKKEAEAKVVVETDRIARQLELKYLDRTMTAEVTARTTKAAGKLATEKGFAGKLKRARETARVNVAARFVDNMDEYKQLIEDDCQPASEESDEILPAERKRVEIKHAAEIIKNLEGDEKHAALEEVDEMALATLKERAEKKKPAPQYLIEKHKTGGASRGVEDFASGPTNAASRGSDRVSAAESSDNPEDHRERVRIEPLAGQKRKRNKPPAEETSSTMTRSKTAKALAMAGAKE